MYVAWLHTNMQKVWHYNDVLMSAMVSQITGVMIVSSAVWLGGHQSSTTLVFVRGIHRRLMVPLIKDQ